MEIHACVSVYSCCSWQHFGAGCVTSCSNLFPRHDVSFGKRVLLMCYTRKMGYGIGSQSIQHLFTIMARMELASTGEWGVDQD